MILAIDPGPIESAYVVYRDNHECHGGRQPLFAFGKTNNEVLLADIGRQALAEVVHRLVIEKIASFGMPVGEEIFETVYWSGRFAQRFAQAFGADRCDRITRHQVKINLCGSARAKDGNIRQAIIDRFGGPAAIKKGGPLYKVSGDVWSALAVALTWCDLKALMQAARAPELAGVEG